ALRDAGPLRAEHGRHQVGGGQARGRRAGRIACVEDRVQEVGLAGPRRPVEEEGRGVTSREEGVRGGARVPVAVTDDEGVEGVIRAGGRRSDGKGWWRGRETEPHRAALAERVGERVL